MLSIRFHMSFDSDRFDEAASVLRSLIGPVRAESGCIATRVQGDTTGDLKLTWVEEWQGIKQFEEHLHGLAFRQIIAVIEMAKGPPAVEIDDIASRRGFEAVEEILGGVGFEREEHETNHARGE